MFWIIRECLIHVGPPEEIKVLWVSKLAVDFLPSPQCHLETMFLVVVGLKNYQYLACMTSHSHQFQPKKTQNTHISVSHKLTILYHINNNHISSNNTEWSWTDKYWLKQILSTIDNCSKSWKLPLHPHELFQIISLFFFFHLFLEFPIYYTL